MVQSPMGRGEPRPDRDPEGQLDEDHRAENTLYTV